MKKFSIKALVAAVALIGVAGHAQAEIKPGDTTSGASGGELVFYAFDGTTKNSFVKDLGVDFATFLSTPTYSSAGSNNIGGDSNWTSFITAQGAAGTTNVKWGVFGTEKTSALAANGVNIITTAFNNVTAATSTSSVRGIDGAYNTTFLGALQPGALAVNYPANNSYFTTSDPNPANWASSMQDNLAGKVSFAADNSIGFGADFYRLSAASSATTNATITTVLSGATHWEFDGNSVYVTAGVAAIPEPETWALMVAGLLLVGGVTRRRLSA